MLAEVGSRRGRPCGPDSGGSIIPGVLLLSGRAATGRGGHLTRQLSPITPRCSVLISSLSAFQRDGNGVPSQLGGGLWPRLETTGGAVSISC